MELKQPVSPEIHFAPMQGYTDVAFRLAYEKTLGGINYYYSPYLSIDNHLEIDNLHDISKNLRLAQVKNLIPQVLPGKLNEFILLTKMVDSLGYKRINLNMGCPYPMVIRKGRGAALIQKPDLVREMIDYVFNFSEMKLSLKIRSGLEDHREIFTMLSNIPSEKIEYIIIHPRTASQLYKGLASVDIVRECIQLYPQIPVVYNGDIISYSDFQKKKVQLPNQNRWMIGRGLLENPFLSWQIQNQTPSLPLHSNELLIQFIKLLIVQIQLDSKDEGHALNRCKNQLAMTLKGFPEYIKFRKKIIKCRSMIELDGITNEMSK